MSRFHLYAVEDGGPKALAIPANAAQFVDLYHGLALGVYTALRTFDHNKFLFLNRHLVRTERSMSLLGWSYRLDRARLLRALHDIVTGSDWPEMRVRIDVLAEPATSLGTTSRELIAIQPFTPPPAELYERGVTVDFASGLERENPRAKTAAFAEKRPTTGGLKQLETTPVELNPPAEDEAAAGGPSVVEPYEYLLLSPDGHILEGTGTNFWAVRDGVIYTAGDGVLEGITREIIFQLIESLALPLRLEAVHLDDIPALQEAALSGSSRAFLPVVEIAGRAIGDGRPGPISGRILDAYQRFVMDNIKPAV